MNASPRVMTDTIDILSRPASPAGSSLKRGAVTLIDRAVQRIENPSDDCTADVHFVRTTIKRLRAMLRLIQPAIAAASFERENVSLQNAARRLAGLRDAAVGEKTLEWLAKAARGKRDKEACKVALDHYRLLGPAKSVAQQKNKMRAVARMLRRSRQDIQRLRIVGDEWQSIGPGLAQVYRSGRKRMKNALTSGDDAAFHRWRTRVKALYYQLQTLESVWPKRLGKTVASLRKLEHKLGADHDLSVLKSILKNAPAKFGDAHARERVNACAHKESRRLRRVSRSLGEAIFADKSRSFIRKFRKHWNTRRKPLR